MPLVLAGFGKSSPILKETNNIIDVKNRVTFSKLPEKKGKHFTSFRHSDFVSNDVQNPGNTFSDKLIFKISRGSMSPDPPRILAPSALVYAPPSFPRLATTLGVVS